MMQPCLDIIPQGYPMAGHGVLYCNVRHPIDRWICTRPPHEDLLHVAHISVGAEPVAAWYEMDPELIMDVGL